ncbi:hypothetical protein amrb99_98200 [Actinomadura sp. RB99]|nr:hypothetical protein [Actinomadura sp. RB99]
MRRGERRSRHRGGGRLADALDRDPLLAFGGGARRLRGLRRGRTGLGGEDVVAGDRAVRARAGDRRQVDAEVLGHLPDGRLGQRQPVFHRLWTNGRRRRPNGGRRGRRGRCGCRGRCLRRRGGRGGHRRRAVGRLAGTALGRRLLDPVADQDGLAFRLLRRGHPGFVGGRDALLAHRRGLRRGLGDRGRDAALGLGAHRDDRHPDVHGLALGDQQLGDHALERAGQLHDRLGRLDLHDRLVDLDGVAGLDVPLDDLRLGQSLADVGQLEQFRAHRRHHAKVRSTASRMRSRSGR